VIGLGPELEAGKMFIVWWKPTRTPSWQDYLSSKADPDTHELEISLGYTHERLLRALADGIFESSEKIGNRSKGRRCDWLSGRLDVRAEIPGVIRGIIMPGFT